MNHVHGSDVLSWCAGAETQIVLYVTSVPPIVQVHTQESRAWVRCLIVVRRCRDADRTVRSIRASHCAGTHQETHDDRWGTLS